MASTKRFEDIEAWKLARELCRILGEIIDNGQFRNSFNRISQVEASSGSIMDNIAEGFERGSKGEFVQFLGFSKGSCNELRSQLYRALYRKYLDHHQFDQLYTMAVHISATNQKLIAYLLTSDIKGVRNKKTSTLNP